MFVHLWVGKYTIGLIQGDVANMGWMVYTVTNDGRETSYVSRSRSEVKVRLLLDIGRLV